MPTLAANREHESKIYIVDDNEDVCRSLHFLISSFYDLEIKVYCSPVLFLKKFSPDWQGCLLMDLFMPAINGIEVLKNLKTLNSKLGVIILSAHGDGDAATQSLAAGAYAYISKPFKIEDVLEKINAILTRR